MDFEIRPEPQSKSARFVVGKKRTPPTGVDTRTVGTVFQKAIALSQFSPLGANGLPLR